MRPRVRGSAPYPNLTLTLSRVRGSAPYPNLTLTLPRMRGSAPNPDPDPDRYLCTWQRPLP